MNLPDLPIPLKFNDMIKTYESYYHEFYLEMVRMSNKNFNDYVKQYFSLLLQLSHSPLTQNSIRAAIGVVCLYRLGYHVFRDLTSVFDRLIPQIDIEYIKFTSWCVGRLIHHPNPERSAYAAQLFTRALSWTRSKGRRARPLAAAYMLESVSFNAGSAVVQFFNQLQIAIWSLISNTSILVLKGTAKAISSFTRSIIRYGRNDLNEYMNFFTKISTKLLFFDDPVRQFGALCFFEELINGHPSYFVPIFLNVLKNVCETTEDRVLLVQSQAFLVITSLSQVDPVGFVDSGIADEMFAKAPTLLLEFPIEVTHGLNNLCKFIPNFVHDRIDEIKQFSQSLLKDESDCAFQLLTALINNFGEEIMPIDEVFLKKLVQLPLSEAYKQFFIAFANIYKINQENEEEYNVFSDLFSIIVNELTKKGNVIIALNIVAKISIHVLYNHESLVNAVWSIGTLDSVEIRCAVPNAIFNIVKSTDIISFETISKKLFQLAIYEPSIKVRCAILQALIDNANEALAGPEFLRFYQIFINDDSSTVREIFYKLLVKLVSFNPMAIIPIIRSAILDAFFVIRNVPSIRKRAKTIRGLPILIKACDFSIKAYSGGFMDIFMGILRNYNPKLKHENLNFLEEDAQISILIGVINSLSLLAPLDPETVSKSALELIPLLCRLVLLHEHRLLTIYTLNLIFVLLSAPASTLEFRIQIPLVIETCSKYIAQTHSRKGRMAALRVFGAIGNAEIHQIPPPKGTQAPSNMDNELARMFFHPNRDNESLLDDALLLNVNTIEQYFLSFVSSSLIELFNNNNLRELYEDIVRALVEILKRPKMSVLSYFDAFIARLLTVLEKGDKYVLDSLIPLFSNLIVSSTHNTSPFLKRCLNLIHNRYSDYDGKCAELFVDLILSLLTAVRDGYAPYAAETISLLVITLDDKKTIEFSISQKVLKAFELIGVYSADLLYLTIPQICDAIITEQTLSEVRIAALETLKNLASSVDLIQFLGPIARSLRYCFKQFQTLNPNKSKNNEDHPGYSSNILDVAFELLYQILKSQGLAFLVNAQPILDFLKSNKLETKELKELLDNVSQGKYGDGFHPLNDNIARSTNLDQSQNQTIVFSPDAIIAKIEDSDNMGRHPESWLNSFIICVISSSPSPSIKACTSLATSYRPLAKKLLNVAFLSIWRKLKLDARVYISNIFKQLLFTLDSNESIALDIINLIVFMDKVEQPMHIPETDLVSVCLRYGNMAYALKLQQSLFEKKQNSPSFSVYDVNIAQIINNLIDIFVHIGQWQNALGVWEKCKSLNEYFNKPEVLAKLRMWDQVEPICREAFEKTHSFESYNGLVESLAALSKWEDISNLQSEFISLDQQQKIKVAPFFAEAALHLSRWKDLDEALKFAPDDSIRCRVLNGILTLHNQFNSNTPEYDVNHINSLIDDLLTKSFSLIASRPISFWSDNQHIHPDTFIACQELVEVFEMKEWLISPQKRSCIMEIWNQRLKTTKRDFLLWNSILPNRIRLAQVRDDTLIQFFTLRGSSISKQIHMNAFNILFPEYDPEKSPDAQKISHAIAQWNLGNLQTAIDEIRDLTTKLSGNLLMRANYFYASWLLEKNGESSNTLHDAYNHLSMAINEIHDENIIKNKTLVDKKTITSSLISSKVSTNISNSSLILPSPIYKELIMHTNQVDMLRKWSDVNASLISCDSDRKVKYSINAITALSRCANLAPSFPDAVQMLNIFFENAEDEEIFNQTSQMILDLPPKLLLQAAPQILIQISHENEKVRNFVHNIVFSLLKVHYHDLVFSLLVLQNSQNRSRAKAAGEVLERLHEKSPEILNEVQLIRSALLRAAVTWNEKIVARINDAYECFQRHYFEKMINIMKSILTMVSEPCCELHFQFLNQYSKNITMLEQILKIYSAGNNSTLNQIVQWCKIMQDSVSEDIKRIRTIQLSAISDELAQKNEFLLAVFGTYKPNKPVNHIKYFVGQLSVYMSKQQPKDVVIKGEDGNFYQYLLKGHEDLRLDERIMQFFRMINSLIMKNSSLLNGNPIQTVNVIPLSISHGLVQWATGTDTLRSVIEQFRMLHSRDPMEEYALADELGTGNYDYLLPIQKSQILERIFADVPDNDLAQFFWLKAPSAESWMKQNQAYTISIAITSIVGYIIGLGDRHPSNLLINRNTGNVVHIDFGDCFERAALRRYLPEVVPFRLTRMMVKALGAGGVNGIFKTAFVNMSQLLRHHKSVLLMVLSIFVHEPLIDPDVDEENSFSGKVTKSYDENENLFTSNSSNEDRNIFKKSKSPDEIISSNKKMKARIWQKLTGNDFLEENKNEFLSVEEQATKLIHIATNIQNLSKMYSGWCPFW